MMWIFDNFDSFFETFNVFWERIVKNKEILIDIRYLYNSRTAHIVKFDEEIVHYLDPFFVEIPSFEVFKLALFSLFSKL